MASSLIQYSPDPIVIELYSLTPCEFSYDYPLQAIKTDLTWNKSKQRFKTGKPNLGIDLLDFLYVFPVVIFACYSRSNPEVFGKSSPILNVPIKEFIDVLWILG